MFFGFAEENNNKKLRTLESAFFIYSLNGPRGSYSSSPESAAGQVLTLADLTPAGSEPNLSSRSRRGTPLIGPSQSLRSSYPDLRHGSTHVSPRERDERDAVKQCFLFMMTYKNVLDKSRHSLLCYNLYTGCTYPILGLIMSKSGICAAF